MKSKRSNAIELDGGYTPVFVADDVQDTIVLNLSANHDRVIPAETFGPVHFDFEGSTGARLLNFVPAEGYVYTEGDEAKLICVDEGYEVYWDAASNTFKLQAAN